MKKKNEELSVANTCATCRFGLFGRTTSPYGNAMRNQMGLCLLHAEEDEPPKVERYSSYAYVRLEWTQDGVKKTANGLSEAAKNGKVFSLHEYKQEFIDQHQWMVRTPEQQQKVEKDLLDYYNRWLTNHEWWERNWPVMRRCHRLTVCGAHECGKAREKTAKAVANGGYSIH